MTIIAIALAFAMIALDDAVESKWVHNLGWIYASGADGARAVLEAVAGSMIGLAGVVFSITIVTLTLTSSQFGPRLLRNFMRDTSNQIVLGTFIATFTYCLLVLRTVQGGDEQAFIPSLSVAVGVVLALASLGVLIYFIHHVSSSIQADNIIAAVSRDIDHAVRRIFPEKLGHGTPRAQAPQTVPDDPPEALSPAPPVPALGRGYLRAIDSDSLLHLASEKDLLIRLAYRPGQFIVPGRALVYVWPGTRVDAQLTAEINGVFVLGAQRTHEQDPEFAFSQLVEIAIRSLSPGINDPFTATTCLDWLSVGLCELAARDLPSPYRYDDRNTLRLIVPGVNFVDIANLVFTRIRQYSRASIMVTLKLLETIAIVAPRTQREADRSVLHQQAIMIKRGSQAGLPDEADRKQVEAYYCIAMQTLEAAMRSTPAPALPEVAAPLKSPTA
jgi:uncharacterized membrane protein